MSDQIKAANSDNSPSDSPANFCAYLCTFCPGTSFASMELLDRHIQRKHIKNVQNGVKNECPNMPIDDTVLPIGCSIPSLPSPGSIHSTSSPSNCSSSSPKTKTPSLLIAELTCKKCPGGRTFPCREQLNLHLANTHRDRPQYSCAQCGASFSIKRELATHNRIHSGEQPHQCEKCGKEFGTRQLLKKHNMWHTGERSHVCAHCGKAFFQKGHLTQHLMIHKGGRPHQCHLCLKTFIFKFDLNRHLKIHSDRSFVCKKCTKCFQLECELEEHSAKCRGGEGAKEAGEGERRRGSKSFAKSKKSPIALSPSAASSPIEGQMMETENGHQEEEEPNTDAPKLENANASVDSASVGPPLLQQIAFHSPASSQNAAISRLAASILTAQSQQIALNGFLCGTEIGHQPQFPCLLCSQKFPSQAAYLLHWSNVHMKGEGGGGMDEGPIMTDDGQPPPTLLMQMHSKGNVAGISPQKVSPSCSSTIADSLASQFDHFPPSLAQIPPSILYSQCPNCPIERQRLMEKERELGEMRVELDKIRIIFMRFGALLNGTFPANGGLQFQQFLLNQIPPQN